MRNKAVYLAIGITCNGHKEVLGLWIEQTEEAKFWLRVMNEFKARGTQDLLVAVVDGLKRFPEAITSVLSDCAVQTCIVHLIRYSLQFASWKESKPLAKALKAIYAAPSAEAAAAELVRFEAGPYGKCYAAVVHSWRWRWRWEEVIPFFAFSTEVRKILYTTDEVDKCVLPILLFLFELRSTGHFTALSRRPSLPLRDEAFIGAFVLPGVLKFKMTNTLQVVFKGTAAPPTVRRLATGLQLKTA